MAVVVCCPCGNPLDCDNLELVVTLTCPRCSRELTLEIEGKQGGNCRALLTIMEGPSWVGERFVMPVGLSLSIGSAGGNWISLESDAVSDTHCRLRVSEQGRVTLEDLGSEAGTWIETQRVRQGTLAACQSFRTGDFRFRLDFEAPDGAASAAPATYRHDAAQPLPTLNQVRPRGTPGRWLIRSRFQFSRGLIVAFAWLIALHHFVCLPNHPTGAWKSPQACLVGLLFLAALLTAGRRVALAHRYFRFAPLGVLLVLAAIDFQWSMPIPALACLLLAAAVAILIIRPPAQVPAILAALLGITAATTMVVLTARDLLTLSFD